MAIILIERLIYGLGGGHSGYQTTCLCATQYLKYKQMEFLVDICVWLVFE